jgi:hypothetical protein
LWRAILLHADSVTVVINELAGFSIIGFSSSDSMAQSNITNSVHHGQSSGHDNLPGPYALSTVLSGGTLIDPNTPAIPILATAPAVYLDSPPLSPQKGEGDAESSVPVDPSTNTPSRGSLAQEKSPEDPVLRLEWDMTRVERAKGFLTRWFVEWWLLEIASWVFSAICMAVILTVLLHYNNHPLPHLGILTLNSLISILSGFAKASLLLPTTEALGQLKWNWFRKPRQMVDFEVIDSASRGPWGSMVLIANTKGV